VTSAARVEVVVALISDPDGRVLVSRRLPGRHMAGYWEFPGGKRVIGEGRREALERELAEELGIRPLDAEPFMSIDHDYPETRVALDVWKILGFTGEPRALEGQEIAWVEAAALREIDLLPADRPIVERLIAGLA